MMLELEVDNNGLMEEANFGVGDDADVASFENERCGICMDLIIDRGVLDSCQHWFCFACIDNWATVTNICPLCQKEFQLITCVPVYDTIGSLKADEDSFPRDDDWCIQGNCNTLSFPSYYIDENAVICLDGDGCKIRNGLVAIEENLNLDTSIACDSCDLWYHAYCVGFVPETSSNNSWLCPRCIIDELPPESLSISTQRQGNQFGPETTGHESSTDAGFSGKVSVSVADAGETAVVVSMVERMQWTQESSDNLLAAKEAVIDPETETSLSNSNATSFMMETRVKETTKAQPNIGARESSLGLSLSQETSLTLHCDSLAHGELVTKSYDNSTFDPNGSDECKVPSQPSIQPCFGSIPSESESSTALHLDLSVRSSLTENQVAGNMQRYNSVKPSLSVGNMEHHSTADVVGLEGVKRKRMSSMNYVEKYNCTENEDGEARAKMETKLSSKKKKARREEKPQMSTEKCQVQDTSLKGFQKSSILVAISEKDKLKDDQEREAETSDIMSIVRGAYQKSSEGHQSPKPTDKSTGDKDSAAGLRVKKIMRRATEDKESSVLVQKLREEIREAVRNKSSKDLGKNIFDPKLLSAFRAAIAGPKTEPVQKLSPAIVKLKRSIVSKGKIRENLTKKIYGTTSGRRRRAWDRDWEIEFWKHRCMRTSKPEKAETLKLVLDLLNKGSAMEQESEIDTANPILSRLYLADTSVFPRKDDIKPLSVLTGVDDQKKNTECEIVEKVSIPIHDNRMVQTPTQSKVSKDSTEMSNSSFDNKGKRSCAPSLKGEATCQNVHPNDSKNRANSISLSSSSKIKSQPKKEMATKSDDVKIDKRQWALEVLARKTDRENKDENKGKQENIGVLKGNYPLLAQLPSDMRPILAPSRHNKVPTSVRQVQLYRLTEHFLRKENLSVICRTAATELAVADAVNIEREVADRSNSKLVYVNLCSQVISQHAMNKKASGAVESKSSPSADTTRTTEPTLEDTLPDPKVEDALRMAGLISDSPPNSPSCLTKKLDDNDPTEKVREEGEPESVFDMDSHPELDIYGDFEYDLDDEDYIGNSALRASKVQPEQGDLKMKVIFSTLNTEKTKNDQDSKDDGRLQTVEVPMESGVLNCEENGGVGISTLEVKGNAPCLPPESLQDEGNEEPSLAECEELYGPDKEPLEKRFLQIASREPDKMIGDRISTEKIALPENESYESNKVARSSNVVTDTRTENTSVTGSSFVAGIDSSSGKNSPNLSSASQNVQRKELKCNDEQSGLRHSISKKVEAYIKEHIRPLCKSGVITVEQYRWAVGKTTEKVMKYHSKAKNANFVIKEGEKLKKLAEQYVEAAQQKGRMEIAPNSNTNN
ncbi:uncharacterized protein At4g10930 isoform X2 [Macadamia integrifolia]|uniref:uncharacterized protein At4g10930 isoform X2 n=1 Tax=Macadamia integrifolia TaxID=60698 RepID=UPI001C532BD8|nr:uncharacterized protein At4g10930 isoform X2 [Macadamia integrifolia]